jgi:hypothetical protein
MKFFAVLAIILFQSINNSVDCETRCPHNRNYSSAIYIKGGVLNAVPTALSSSCIASLSSDFPARYAMPQYPTNCVAGDRWGPTPITYPVATIPSDCDSTSWQQQRVLRIISSFVNQSWNYCHHHAPGWIPPVSERATTDETSGGGSGSGGQCSSNYWGNGPVNINSNAGWQGIDCTSYTSFVYNFGFGSYLNALTGNQACGPNAPGVALPYTASQQSQFQPGDILFIASNGNANPLSISHAVLWTGIKLTYDKGPFSNHTLSQNFGSVSQLKSVIAYINQQNRTGQPVYVISDSRNAGPNYRPFAGWYVSAFTFARRLINPGSTFPSVAPNAYFENRTCSFTRQSG